MTDRVSPWVRRTIAAYLVVIAVGWVMGLVSGGLGAFWIMPLLLPWVAIVPGIELVIHRPILDGTLFSVISVPLSAALNASLLFLLLRHIDRHRRADKPVETGAEEKRSWLRLLPLFYAGLVGIGIVLGSLEQFETVAAVGGLMVLWLTFPWDIALFFIPHQLPGIVDNVVLPMSAGLLNMLLLYLFVRSRHHPHSGDAVAAE